MVKKIILSLAIVFLFTSVSIADTEITETATSEKMEIPTTSRHIEQIKWAYNQGYMWGMLASYGLFKQALSTTHFVLPVIITAWETGYVKAVLDIQQNKWVTRDEE